MASLAHVRPAVRLEDGVTIPEHAGTLEGFTGWALSRAFPASGRIDFLQGTIEMDMSPEDLQTHGKPKTRLATYIDGLVAAEDLGEVYVDRTRLHSGKAGLSCEPDVLFVSWESLQSGRARHVRAASNRPGRFVEIEGACDLAVEVVSEGSASKDLERLPPLYALAGVRELWIVDARGADVDFRILHLHGGAYRRAKPDAQGRLRSKVLGRRLRLRREPGRLPETWRYLVEDEA